MVKGRSACYHVISRTSCGQYLFGEKEKEMFLRMVRKQASFCGMEVVSYTVMSNHFHLLLRVPYEEQISDRELLRRYRKLYGAYVPFSAKSPQELSRLFRAGGKEAAQERRKLMARMGDLSVFMRELKQRFGIWYNRSHGNRGTIWSDRYKSLLVEDDYEALSVVSAYIDLNAVRAEIVDDPAKYRYCSYSEAMGGGKEARKGLMSIYGKPWGSVITRYRMVLYIKGQKVKGVDGKDRGVVRTKICEAVLSGKGEVTLSEAIRCRVRYFSDGMVLGSGTYVEAIFKQERLRFGKNRKRGGHDLRGIASEDLKVMRDLRVGVLA